MKLLFDQHFSYRLVNRLGDLFPESNQVRLLGMARHSDSDIWYYAQYHGYILVTPHYVSYATHDGGMSSKRFLLRAGSNAGAGLKRTA